MGGGDERATSVAGVKLMDLCRDPDKDRVSRGSWERIFKIIFTCYCLGERSRLFDRFGNEFLWEAEEGSFS